MTPSFWVLCGTLRLGYFNVNQFVFIIDAVLLVKQLLKSSGSYTVVDRDALKMCKKRFFWMVVAFTVW